VNVNLLSNVNVFFLHLITILSYTIVIERSTWWYKCRIGDVLLNCSPFTAHRNTILPPFYSTRWDDSNELLFILLRPLGQKIKKKSLMTYASDCVWLRLKNFYLRNKNEQGGSGILQLAVIISLYFSESKLGNISQFKAKF